MKYFIKITLAFVVGSILISNGSSTESNSKHPQHPQSTNETNIGTNRYNTVIAQVINGDTILANNISELVVSWEHFVGDALDVTVKFDKILLQGDGSHAFIVGVDIESNSTSKIELDFDNDFFYEMVVSGGGKTCTCSGCTSTGTQSQLECQPTKGTFDWYCTDCSQGSCVKTVTATADAILKT